MDTRSLLLTPLLALGLAACGTDDGNGTPFSVTATGPDGVAIQAASRFSLSVYGYDPGIEDTGATLILTQVEPVTALPLEVAVVLPADAAARVDPRTSPEAPVAYYLTSVYVDVDGDGQVCAGDLSQDYGLDGPLDVPETGGTVAIPLKLYDAGPCRDFPTATP